MERDVNLYVKNLDNAIDDERLRKEFAPYGTITSAKVMLDGGQSKGFGFVCFSSPEEATKAVTEMDGRIIENKPLYVALAQRKEDRKAHLASQYLQRINSEEKIERSKGVNLFVKNLDIGVDDERLRKEFAPYGTITSAKVMLAGGRSKGFGFVCFSSPKEATKAATEMNGRFMGMKRLYVALAQRKEDREAHLTSQIVQRMKNMGVYPVKPMFNQANADASFVRKLSQPQLRFYGPAMVQMRQTPRWAQPQVRPNAQGPTVTPMTAPCRVCQRVPIPQNAAALRNMTSTPITNQVVTNAPVVQTAGLARPGGQPITTVPVAQQAYAQMQPAPRPGTSKYMPTTRSQMTISSMKMRLDRIHSMSWDPK